MKPEQSYFKAYLESAEAKINEMKETLSGLIDEVYQIPTGKNSVIDVENVLRIYHGYEDLHKSLNVCLDKFESARLKEGL